MRTFPLTLNFFTSVSGTPISSWIFCTMRPSYVKTSVQRRPTVKSTMLLKPFRNFVWRSMCFSSSARCPGTTRRRCIFRVGVIWHGTTKQTFFSPFCSASASARLFGQWVCRELALAIASATVVTTLASGGRHRLVRRRNDGAVEESFAEPCARIALTTPPSGSGRDLRILAARRDDAPVAAEEASYTPGSIGRTWSRMSNSRMPSRGQTCAQTSQPIPSLMPQSRRGGRLRDLLRLRVDVVDDVVRADEDAGPALAALPKATTSFIICLKLGCSIISGATLSAAVSRCQFVVSIERPRIYRRRRRRVAVRQEVSRMTQVGCDGIVAVSHGRTS
jgi:hypothetical protein